MHLFALFYFPGPFLFQFIFQLAMHATVFPSHHAVHYLYILITGYKAAPITGSESPHRGSLGG